MGDVEMHLLYIKMSTNRSYRKVDKHCNYRISKVFISFDGAWCTCCLAASLIYFITNLYLNIIMYIIHQRCVHLYCMPHATDALAYNT